MTQHPLVLFCSKKKKNRHYSANYVVTVYRNRHSRMKPQKIHFDLRLSLNDIIISKGQSSVSFKRLHFDLYVSFERIILIHMIHMY